MRLPRQVTTFIEEIGPALEALKRASLPKLESIAIQYGGFVQSRIKKPESLALKLMKGELAQATDCVDLFAATIVVPDHECVREVQTAVQGSFVIQQTISHRVTRPTVFDYDDIHLIVTLKPESYEQPKQIHSLVFELQVKTLLQFAVSKATHDAVYKGDKVTSRRIRLASEIRALFEMAEALASNISIADDVVMFDESPQISDRNRIADFIKEHWPKEDWPGDFRRACLTVYTYLELAGLKLPEFLEMMKNDQYAKYMQLRSLDPITALLAACLEHAGPGFVAQARRRKNPPVLFLVPEGAEELAEVLRSIPPDLRVGLALP